VYAGRVCVCRTCVCMQDMCVYAGHVCVCRTCVCMQDVCVCRTCVYAGHVCMQDMCVCRTCVYAGHVCMQDVCVCRTCVYAVRVCMQDVCVCRTRVCMQDVCVVWKYECLSLALFFSLSLSFSFLPVQWKTGFHSYTLLFLFLRNSGLFFKRCEDHSRMEQSENRGMTSQGSYSIGAYCTVLYCGPGEDDKKCLSLCSVDLALISEQLLLGLIH
jgi:hypothetical protein